MKPVISTLSAVIFILTVFTSATLGAMSQLPDFDPTIFAGTDFSAQSSSPCLYDATQAWYIGFRWEGVQGTPKANETYVRRVLDRECWDDDSDGHYDEACGGDDCDDADPDTYPGALESCDGKDNDCDGTVPSDEEDADGDGYIICENGWLSTAGVIGESHVYALLETSNGYIYAGSFPGGDISRTSDGGATWTPTQQHVPNANAIYDLIEASDGYIYAGVSDTSEPDGEVFRTGDGGATWEPTADLNGATLVNCLLEASDGALYAGTYPYADVFRTDDGGVTWINTAEISGAIIIESLEEGADGTIYAGTGNDGNVYKTSDGGASWTSTSNLDGAIHVQDLLAASDGFIYAGTEPNGVFRTNDGGITWEFLSGLNFKVMTLIEAYGSIWAGGTREGSAYAYRTSDGGATWLAMELSGAVFVNTLLKASDGYIYAGTGENGTVSKRNAFEGDCDDGNEHIYPGAPELCDGLDNNCDGVVPAAEIEGDIAPFGEGDGRLSASDFNLTINCIKSMLILNDEEVDLIDVAPVRICDSSTVPISAVPEPDGRLDATDLSVLLQAASGYMDLRPADIDGDGFDDEICGGDDCDDSYPGVNPGAAEVADDGIDQDCNGADTITCIVDADMDGYGTDVGTTVLAPDGSCDTADGEANDSTDCDDSDPDVNPGVEESRAAGNCSDGVDNDCDGLVDLYEACFMVEIPAGEFVMGSDPTDPESFHHEYPEHVVYLSGYEIDLYEVTNSEFADFLNAYGSNESPEGYKMLDADSSRRHIYWEDISSSWYAEGGYEDHPAIEVSWYGANTFCDYYWKRLLTEAEWEKAARGGCEVGGDPGTCEDPADERTYPWGEGLDCDHASYSGCGVGTTPVGSYPLGVSPYGVYDMAGNVYEWVKDWYDQDYYDDSLYQDPSGPASGSERVLRGGSYASGPNSPRAANRGSYDPDSSSSPGLGFRCAR